MHEPAGFGEIQIVSGVPNAIGPEIAGGHG